MKSWANSGLMRCSKASCPPASNGNPSKYRRDMRSGDRLRLGDDRIDETTDLRCRSWLAEKVALHRVEALGSQAIEVAERLHTLGGRRNAEAAAEADHTDDRSTFRIRG